MKRDILNSLRKRRLPDEWLGAIEQETWLTAIKRIEDKDICSPLAFTH